MDDPTHDFGTGLRAHLGLEAAEIDLLADGPAELEETASEPVADAEQDDESSKLETLIAFEHELLERERDLARRERGLAARAGALLAAAQSLHDEVVGGASRTDPRRSGDELARLRQRKSGAA